MAVFTNTWTSGPVFRASDVPETSLIRRADWSSQAVISGPSFTGAGVGVGDGRTWERVRVVGDVFDSDAAVTFGGAAVDVLVGRRVRVVVIAGSAACADRASCFTDGLVLGEITGVSCWAVSEAPESTEGVSVDPQPAIMSVRLVRRQALCRYRRPVRIRLAFCKHIAYIGTIVRGFSFSVCG